MDTLFVLRKPAVTGGEPPAGETGVLKQLRALRRVGLQPTDADRECLHSGQLAVQADA